MKFGIIGTGMIANFHAEAIAALEGSSLHSVYDRRGEAADAFAEKNGVAGHHDIDSFLADPELDIVTIGTPSGAHMEPAIAAANAGKHVIVEKPMEITPDRIDQMIAACDANNVTLSGVFNRRFHPAMQAFKAAADAGRFGTPTMAGATIHWFRDQAYYDSGAWRGTWDLDGGGALMNQGIHTIDQMLYVAGDVKRVIGSTACLAHERIEVEDTAVAVLEFANGTRGVIQGSTACWSSTGHPAEVYLCGDRGSVFMNDEVFRVWDFLDATPEDDEIRNTLMAGSEAAGQGANDPSAINCDGHIRNFADVVGAIEAGRNPAVDGAEARRAVQLICAVYESARNNGVPVEL